MIVTVEIPSPSILTFVIGVQNNRFPGDNMLSFINKKSKTSLLETGVSMDVANT